MANVLKANQMKTIFLYMFITTLLGRCNGICQVAHPQTAVCNADYVVRGTVLSISVEKCKNDVTLMRAYASAVSVGSNQAHISTNKIIRVRLRKMFKGYRYINNTVGSEFEITASSPYSIPLWPGIEYLLTGYVINKKPYMNSCSWHQPWAISTVTQGLGLRRFYWTFCGCQIKDCYNNNCGLNPRQCNWHVYDFEAATKKMDCNSRHSVCMVTNGRCQWGNPVGKRLCPKDDTKPTWP